MQVNLFWCILYYRQRDVCERSWGVRDAGWSMQAVYIIFGRKLLFIIQKCSDLLSYFSTRPQMC